MKTLTHKQLVNKLAKRKGAVILGIVAVTDAKARKKDNPFEMIQKVTHKTVITGASYQKAVDKQGAVDFKADALPYGKFAVKDKVIETDGGEYQLRVVGRNPRKPVSVTYLADGAPISKGAIDQFLPTPKGSAKQEAAGLKGKKQVKVNNYSFSNIREIHLDKEIYKLVP
jgi:hypothetical protein